MHAGLSRKRGGSGNRRIRAIKGTGDANDNGNGKSGKQRFDSQLANSPHAAA